MRGPLSMQQQAQLSQRWGEVIETSTTEFVAQCDSPEELRFPTMPPLGSWVQANDTESDCVVYGVICHATTVPIDSVHRARPLGLSLQELQDQHPQIFAMLRTEFRVAIMGFEPAELRSSAVLPRQYLPPRPPQIHQGVFPCDSEAIARFCQSLDFLRTLLKVSNAPTDELVAAVLRQSVRALESLDLPQDASRTWLLQAGRTLALLLRDDYDRLKAILAKLEPLHFA